MDPSTSATLLAAPVPHRRDTTRSERMLREMLNKDARSRSQSRGPPSSNGSQRTEGGAAGTTPRKPRPLATNTSHNSLASNPSASALSMASSCAAAADMDDGPMFAAGGLGAPSAGVHSAHIYRPHLPSPRKTHDGIVSPSPMRASSPAIPSRHATVPAPLVHANSSPLFTAQKQSSRDWSFDETSSPSTTSSSGSPSHNPSTPSSFNLHLASEFCRQQQGYVSFAEIEGLGRPAGEDEDERKERERIEAEYRRKKAWFGWGWLEDGILTGGGPRPKTPAAPENL